MANSQEQPAERHIYAALILNYLHWKETVACVESLLDSAVPPQRIVVCDNCSSNDSLDQLCNWAEQAAHDGRLGRWSLLSHDRVDHVTLPDGPSTCELLLVSTGSNLGYAGGNNVGLRLLLRLGTPFIWLLNNDTVVHPSAAHKLLKYMQSNPRCGQCGTLTRYLEEPEVVQCLGGGWYNHVWGRGGLYGEGLRLPLGAPAPQPSGPLGYVNGASVFLRREFLQQIGLMEEAYFLYCEEIDWAERAQGRWELGWEPRAEVFHREGASTGLSNRRGCGLTVRARLRLLRSRLILAWKFYPWALPTVLLGQVAAVVRRMLSGRIWETGR